MPAPNVAENVSFQPNNVSFQPDSRDLSPAARHLVTISPEQLAGELWAYEGLEALRILKHARKHLAGSSVPEDICRHRLLVEQIVIIERSES